MRSMVVGKQEEPRRFSRFLLQQGPAGAFEELEGVALEGELGTKA